MTIPMWPALGYNRGPIAQVQPFTYQDDVTFLEILYKLRDYIKDVIAPTLNALSTHVDEEIAELVAYIDASIAASAEGLGEHIDSAIAELTEYVNNAVQTIIDNSVEVQDPLATQIFEDANSQLRQAMNAVYVGKGDVELNVMDFGAVGDGVTYDSLALSAAYAALPAEGGVIRFPAGKTYAIYHNLNLEGKSVSIKADGANFVYVRNSAQIRLAGGFDESYPVINLTENRFTTNDDPLNAVQVTIADAFPASWRRGDIVRVFSDDIIPGSRDSGDPSILSQGRLGQFLQVHSVIGNTVNLLGVMEDAQTTNVRIARLKSEHSISWEGGTFTYSDEAYNATNVGNYMLILASARNPIVDNIRVRQWPRVAIQLTDCYGWRIKGEFEHGKNALSLSHYGYAVANYGSCYGVLHTSRFGQVRHGYTNGHSFIAAGTNSPELRGRPHDNLVVDSIADSATASGFDSHTSGLRERFINCQTLGGRVGYSLRGKYNLIENCSASNVLIGVESLEEGTGGVSYGHQITNLSVDNVDSIFVNDMSRNPIRPATYQQLITIPTIFDGVRARNVRAREWLAAYSTIILRNYNVIRSGTGTAPDAVKCAITYDSGVQDYTAVTTPTALINAVTFASGAGVRNQIRVKGVSFLNTATNLNAVVQGTGADSAYLTATGNEARFVPVTGVGSHAFTKIPEHVALTDVGV